MQREDDENPPVYLRICQFEDCLKKRIFYSDRVERIEKVLLNLQMINSNVHFCSREELLHFRKAIEDPEVLT